MERFSRGLRPLADVISYVPESRGVSLSSSSSSLISIAEQTPERKLPRLYIHFNAALNQLFPCLITDHVRGERPTSCCNNFVAYFLLQLRKQSGISKRIRCKFSSRPDILMAGKDSKVTSKLYRLKGINAQQIALPNSAFSFIWSERKGKW